MANEVRRRAACDRCHSQKIRCPRQNGSEICDRCMKARKPCVFAPFRQKKIAGGDLEDVVSGVAFTPQAHDHVLEHSDKVGPGRQKRKRTTESSSRYRFLSISTYTNIGFEDTASYTVPDEPPVQIAGLDTDPLGLDWLPSSYPNPEEPTPDIAFDNFNFGTSGQYAIDFSTMIAEEPDVFAFTNEVQSRKNTNLDRSLRSTSNLLHGPNFARSTPQLSSLGRTQFSWAQAQETKPVDSIPKFIRKLSQLNVDLSDHKSTLPPLSIHDDLPPELDTEPPQKDDYVLEDTFRLTQSLIEIYPTFLHLFINPMPSSQITTPESEFLGSDTFGSDATPPSDETSSSTSSSPKHALDHASILLVISCHLRVIDIFDILFKHMETCISQKGMVKNARQAALSAPTLSIGTYLPPPSAAVPMQMLLLVQFATQLYDYAVDLASEIPYPQDKSSSGGTVDSTLLLTKAAAENVKERAASMSQRLSGLRAEMLQSGLLA
ncbi:hypothetical protein VTL71DRAFT_4857 [Oculimacula yallundae]|uniref:Zn(2)-C6 fungal-type domain-containing protein n=1 Tax=Oculimacula yallundae TaxID=86028 RepID=A0ABR4C347_9HELO